MPNVLVISGEYNKPKQGIRQFRTTLPLLDSTTTKDVQHIVHDFSRKKMAVVTRTEIKPINFTQPSK